MVFIYTGIMAAPTTAYITEKGHSGLADSASSMTAVKDVSLAKFLQNTSPATGEDWGDGYFNAADSLAERDAKIRDIFKLDGFAVMVKGDGEKTFVGFCYSRTSPNGLYHKTERFSGVKVPITTNTTAELLIDAGLNTKPILPVATASPSAVGSATETPNNAFLATFNIRSAYYLATEWGVKIKSLGCQNTSNPAHYIDASYHTKVVSTIGIGQSSSIIIYDADPIVVDDPSIIGNYLLFAPNYYEVWITATNDEGTREIQLSTFLAVPYSLSLKYSPTSFDAAANTLTSGTYYKNSATIGAYTYLFYDQAAGTPSDGGYYVEPYAGVQYTYALRTTSTGQIDLETVYNWGNQRTPWDYYGFAASNVQSSTQLQAAYDQAFNGSWTDIGDIYYAITDEFYAASTGTTWATNGYYMIGMGINNDLATAVWIRLYDGQVVESNNY